MHPHGVSGSTTTVYIFSGSKVIAAYDLPAQAGNGAAPTAPSREYVYGGGALLARIDSSGAKYYHQDQLCWIQIWTHLRRLIRT
jgi:hypothetical protein